MVNFAFRSACSLSLYFRFKNHIKTPVKGIFNLPVRANAVSYLFLTAS